MFERKIISDLEHWKDCLKNKALLIKGARQVGKTTFYCMNFGSNQLF